MMSLHQGILILGFWYISFCQCLVGQNTVVEILSFEDYLSIVKNYHPIVQQGDLLIETGDNLVLAAKGGFDPKIQGGLSQKRFKRDPYYSILNMNLDVLTKTGIKFSGGYDRTSGINLNPERLDPDAGLVYTGVSVPLGRGLLFDQRRAQLEQARVARELTEVDQRLLLNGLMYDASAAYWNWWLTFADLEIFRSAVDVARDQKEAVLQAALGGDRPYIDTVEATIQYQNLILRRDQALLDYATAAINMSSYLWNDENEAILVEDDLIPADPQLAITLQLSQLIRSESTSIIDEHPIMESYNLKLQQLNIEQRMARENMKPTIDVKYNLLVDVGDNISNTLSLNNYNWGVNLAMPLLFRKEKAKMNLNKIYISDTELSQTFKKQELLNKLTASIRKWEVYQEQYSSYANVVENYNTMLAGELELFASGESSQFLVNSRQSKYIEAQLKLNELYFKIRSSEIESYFSAGITL